MSRKFFFTQNNKYPLSYIGTVWGNEPKKNWNLITISTIIIFFKQNCDISDLKYMQIANIEKRGGTAFSHTEDMHKKYKFVLEYMILFVN